MDSKLRRAEFSTSKMVALFTGLSMLSLSLLGNAQESTARPQRSLTLAIEAMRNNVPRDRFNRVHILATVAHHPASDTVVGNIDASFEVARNTITHIGAKNRFTTRFISSANAMQTGADNGGTHDGSENQKDQKAVGYASVRLDRHPGILPLFEPWVTSERTIVKPSIQSDSEIVDGVACQTIEVYVPQGNLAPPTFYRVYLRVDTGELRAVEFKENIGRIAPVNVLVRIVYDDFANLQGLRTPTKITRLLNGIPESVFRITSLELVQ